MRKRANYSTRLLSRCNDVGLLAEEFDPLTGRMLGNFPQAYSHVGLINCALNLTRQKARQKNGRSSKGPPRDGALCHSTAKIAEIARARSGQGSSSCTLRLPGRLSTFNP